MVLLKMFFLILLKVFFTFSCGDCHPHFRFFDDIFRDCRFTNNIFCDWRLSKYLCALLEVHHIFLNVVIAYMTMKIHKFISNRILSYNSLLRELARYGAEMICPLSMSKLELDKYSKQNEKFILWCVSLGQNFV